MCGGGGGERHQAFASSAASTWECWMKISDRQCIKTAVSLSACRIKGKHYVKFRSILFLINEL